MSKAFDPADWARRHIVEESATATAERIEIKETPEGQISDSRVLAEADGKPVKRKIKIISPGWGSSGFYSREVLERDIPRIYPAGTHMYLNHPSLTEDIEQPERRVEDLAATLVSAPVAESDGSMWAEAQIFDHHAEVINSIAESIGVSIRAWGESVHGEAEGQHGDIITKLLEGRSVDFVTLAGRGGEVGPLIESARQAALDAYVEEARNAGNWLEAKLHREFTWIADNLFAEGHLSRDERIKLSQAVGEALDAFNESVKENIPQLYSRDPFDDPEAEGALDERKGRSGGKTTKEDEMSDEDKKTLSEMEDRLKAVEKRAEEAESKTEEAEQRAERAEDALARERAKDVVAEALDPEREVEEGEEENALPELPERARKRVVEAALKGDLPLDEDGKLDRDKITERARKAAREEAEYLNGSSESGKVRGVGAPVREGATASNGDGAEMSEATEKKLVEHFKSRGMSEDAAKIAAKGR